MDMWKCWVSFANMLTRVAPLSGLLSKLPLLLFITRDARWGDFECWESKKQPCPPLDTRFPVIVTTWCYTTLTSSGLCNAVFNVISVDTHSAVYEADVLREVWTRFTNSGPGTGGSDRCVKRHQDQVWKHIKTGHSTNHAFSKHGADTAGSRRHLHRPQPKITRVAGTVLPKLPVYSNMKIEVSWQSFSVFLHRTSLGTMQRHKSCCVRMAKHCSVPSTSLCLVSTRWSTKQWRTPWWPLSCMKMQGNRSWHPV